MPVFALVLLAAALALAGCGDSSSSTSSEAQLEAAKREGEEAAHEKDRIDNLQKQVRSLKKQANSTVVVGHDSGTGTTTSEGGGAAVLRTFHAPSGNVSCEILSDGALCSVGSIARTFAFSDGQAAHIAPGALLAQGAGELAPYGSTISEASVTCTIPLSSEPRGVVCTDADSGHGFEASRISGRQHVY